MNKLWAGRFSKQEDERVNDFNSSIAFDARMAQHDIQGSIAHATMLGEQGIIAKEEAEKIVEALRKCPYSKDAAIIGEVTEDQPGKVVMTTEIGTQALLPQPGGELLPRIC